MNNGFIIDGRKKISTGQVRMLLQVNWFHPFYCILLTTSIFIWPFSLLCLLYYSWPFCYSPVHHFFSCSQWCLPTWRMNQCESEFLYSWILQAFWSQTLHDLHWSPSDFHWSIKIMDCISYLFSDQILYHFFFIWRLPFQIFFQIFSLRNIRGNEKLAARTQYY